MERNNRKLRLFDTGVDNDRNLGFQVLAADTSDEEGDSDDEVLDENKVIRSCMKQNFNCYADLVIIILDE